MLTLFLFINIDNTIDDDDDEDDDDDNHACIILICKSSSYLPSNILITIICIITIYNHLLDVTFTIFMYKSYIVLCMMAMTMSVVSIIMMMIVVDDEKDDW